MKFWQLLQITRELWKEWELRLLVLLSLFFQLNLATQVSRRKSNSKYRFQITIWIMYLLADSIATFTLGVLSNRLANIRETKGTTDLKSQITAFWAPFLLLHLGGPDTVTAFILEDNELWLKQLAQLCVQGGLSCFIYFMALSGSTLSVLAVVMILVGFIKYAERILCLYLASKGQLRDSMLSLPDFGAIHSRIMKQNALKKEEGYRVRIEHITEALAPVDVPVNSRQAYSEEEDTTLVKAYELFQIFKLLFLDLIRNFSDLDASKRIFMDPNVDSMEAFEIVEIELSCMHDLLYTKMPLLKGAWGNIRWVINLSVLCAVLVFFSLQDKKDYPEVDICITFMLISVAIFLDIYSLLQAISSDWIRPLLLQRPRRCRIWPDVAFLKVRPHQRWSRSVAQFSLLKLSVRRRNWIFNRYPTLVRLDQRLEKNFHISYKEFGTNLKDWIFRHMRETIGHLERNGESIGVLASHKLAAGAVLKRSPCSELIWSVEEMELDQSILTWHVATELCYYEDRRDFEHEFGDHIVGIKMSKLVSRYMLYLMLLHPSMLPTGIGVLRYEDTLVDIQKFLKDKQVVSSKNDGSMSSVVIKWARNLFQKEAPVSNGVCDRNKKHKSRKLYDLHQVRRLLASAEVNQLPERKMRRGKNRSVLFDACDLASQLREFGRDKWDLIGKVWATLLMCVAFQSRGYEHCARLSRGGELLSHVWLLMAHLGMAKPVQTFEAQCLPILIVQ